MKCKYDLSLYLFQEKMAEIGPNLAGDSLEDAEPVTGHVIESYKCYNLIQFSR